jgi:methylated-DNA-[protein]-cysteine S-methyltransferase
MLWRGSAATPGGTLYFAANDDTTSIIHASFRDEIDKNLTLRKRSNLHTACMRYSDGELDAFEDYGVDQGDSDFTRSVYSQMRRIPPGTTQTYGELAKISGSPGAARAVGSVCARNRIVLIVPCHRVVAAQGIGGYEYGAAVKKKLLSHEGFSKY